MAAAQNRVKVRPAACCAWRLRLARLLAFLLRLRYRDTPMHDPKRILVVEDHRDTLNMLGLYLSGAGLLVETATDGMEAVAKVSASPPDAIVLDLGLPTVDGWNVARRVKADARTRDIPIIAVSGQYGLGEMNDRAQAVGFATCLVKPCAPSALLQALRMVLTQP